MASDWYWGAIGVLGFIVLLVLLKQLYTCIQNVRNTRKLSRWSRKTKGSNKIIIHCVPIGKKVPSPSPFVVKLITFVRMSKLPYEIDTSDPFGGKGKTPWMSVNGENVADSELIIQYILKNYDVKIGATYTPEQLAVAEALRIVCDEHMFWGMALERFAFAKGSDTRQVVPIPGFLLPVFKRVIKGRAEGQGIGVHSQEEIEDITRNDLRVISTVLGNKQFILGDEPCVADAGIFGQIAQFKWGLPNNPYLSLLAGECKNLDDYCERMRSRFWSDWSPK